jgi:hypothetical protein
MLTKSLETGAVQTAQSTAVNNSKDNLSTSTASTSNNITNHQFHLYQQQQQQQHFIQALLAQQQQLNNKYTINDQTMGLDNEQYYQRVSTDFFLLKIIFPYIHIFYLKIQLIVSKKNTQIVFFLNSCLSIHFSWLI